MTNIIKEKKKLGRKPTLLPKKIIEAIQEIQAEGRDATPSIIRKKIGFGGLENISNVLEEYQTKNTSKLPKEVNKRDSHILPPVLEDKISILISDISKQVNDFSVESDLLANNLAEKKARSTYDVMIDSHEKLVDEQTLTMKIFDEIEAKKDELIEQVSDIEVKLETEINKSSTLDIELSKKQDELSQLELARSDLQTALSTSKTKNITSDKLITKLETRLEYSIIDKDKAVSESNDLRTQLTELSTKLKSSDAMIELLKFDISAVKSERVQSISDLQLRITDLSSKLQKKESEYQTIKEELITITTQLSAQKDVLKEKNERITDLRKKLTEPKTIK